MDAPINVWNEVRITADGISISLLSESADSAAIVEDELWFTFDELEEMAPAEPQSLNLSPQSKNALVGEEQSEIAEYVDEELIKSQSENLPAVGDVLRDSDAPDWSEDDRVQVVGISDKSAAEYEINDGPLTVNDVNDSCHPDETVIEGIYLNQVPQYSTGEVAGYDDSDVYALPESRLEEILSQKEWHDEYGN